MDTSLAAISSEQTFKFIGIGVLCVPSKLDAVNGLYIQPCFLEGRIG